MRIVVLCGGISTERTISISSGLEVCKALRSRGHQAILLDVYFGNPYADLMNAFPDEYDPDAEAAQIHEHDRELESSTSNPARTFFGPNVIKLCKMADIVFMALHGENGEDGRVQAAFDLNRIRYTGTGHMGSSISMDKHISKLLLKAHGVPVPDGYLLKKGRRMDNPETYGLSYPVVVKVCRGGSSVGVYMANDAASYAEAVRSAFAYEDQVLVEQYIRGREFSIGVIEGEALPIIEIAPLDGFYDYRNKYTAGATIETCPAELPGNLTRKMKDYAEMGCKALFIESYGRLDFMMDEKENMYCLEANTLPGMTPTSLIPQEAAALGIDFPTLCEKLIEVSINRYEGKEG